MPVENIYKDSSLMFNKTPNDGVLADSFYSFLGDIHEDEEFNEADLKLIKDKDPTIAKQFRYITEAKANAKRKEREELEEESAEAEEAQTIGDTAFLAAPDSK